MNARGEGRQPSIFALGIFGVWALTLALPAQSHHSHGNYDATYIDLEGTVREVHLINPHSWIYLDVRGAEGQVEIWTLEATSRIGLERIGVTSGDVQAGDTIKVRCHALRDGSRGCLLGFVKTSDGSVLDWDGNNLPIPADL